MIPALNANALFLREMGQYVKEAGEIITRVSKDLEEPQELTAEENASLPWIRWNRWQIPVFAIFCELSRTFLNWISVNPNNVAIGLAGTASLAGAFVAIWFHAALSPLSWVALLLTTSVAMPAAIVAIGVTVQKTSMLLDEQVKYLFSQRVYSIYRAAQRANLPPEIPLNKLHWLYRLHQGAAIGTHFLRIPSYTRDVMIDSNRGLFNMDSEYLGCKIKYLARQVKQRRAPIAPEQHDKLKVLLRPKVSLDQFKREVRKLT